MHKTRFTTASGWCRIFISLLNCSRKEWYPFLLVSWGRGKKHSCTFRTRASSISSSPFFCSPFLTRKLVFGHDCNLIRDLILHWVGMDMTHWYDGALSRWPLVFLFYQPLERTKKTSFATQRGSLVHCIFYLCVDFPLPQKPVTYWETVYKNWET